MNGEFSIKKTKQLFSRDSPWLDYFVDYVFTCKKKKINNEIDEYFAAYSGYTSHMVNIVDKMKKY